MNYSFKTIMFCPPFMKETKAQEKRRRKTVNYLRFQDIIDRHKDAMNEESLVRMLVEVYSALDQGSFRYDWISESARKSLRLVILDNFPDTASVEEL